MKDWKNKENAAFFLHLTENLLKTHLITLN